MKRYLLTLLLALTAAPLLTRAQGVGVGTATPAASAALDVSSSTKGFLPPRLSQPERDGISAPALGLTIFNKTTNALNVWDGTRWVAYLADNTPPAGTPPPAVFAYTGAPQTYTVPAGVTSLGVDMAGAAGGPKYALSTGQGLGGRTQAVLAVVPGQVLTLYVGGAGTKNGGGFNGGGGASAGDGGGGGASDLRQGGAALADRGLVAGGGGGGGDYSGGGSGGDLNGGAGLAAGTNTGGGGGTQTAPGAGGSPSGNAGSGAGGGAGNGLSGGGGGGYFGGGGGGDKAGGGGGSSFAGAGTSAVTHTQGVEAGNGYVRLFPNSGVFTLAAPVLDASNFVNLPAGDNLGNHTATQALSLNSFPLNLRGTAASPDLNYQLAYNGGVDGPRLFGSGGGELGESSGTYSPVLRWTNTGRVGIGTGAPASPLHVKRTGSFDVATFEADQPGPHLSLTQTGGGGTAFVDYIGTVGTGGYRAGALELRGVNAVQLYGNGNTSSPDLTVAASGRIGIGSTAPISQLANTATDIVGSDGYGGDVGSLTWAASQPGYVGMLYNGQLGAGGNGLAVKVGGTDRAATAFDVSTGSSQATAGTSLLSVRASGATGLGTAPTESYRLAVGAATGQNGLFVQLPVGSASQSLKLEQRGSNLIVRPAVAGGGSTVVENTGGNLLLNPTNDRVGIGTTAPRAKLDVNGSVFMANYSRGFSVKGASKTDYTWNHNLGYKPVLMLTVDQTGGRYGEYITYSYQDTDDNTTVIRVYNNYTDVFFTSEFTMRWIVVGQQ